MTLSFRQLSLAQKKTATLDDGTVAALCVIPVVYLASVKTSPRINETKSSRIEVQNPDMPVDCDTARKTAKGTEKTSVVHPTAQ